MNGYDCSIHPIDDATMKHLWILGCLLLCLGLGSCQCSDQPDVGPVEEAEMKTVTDAASRAVV